MESYIRKIIVPYMDEQRKKHGLPTDHPGLVIFDVFRGQCTATVNTILQDNNILYVHVLANCTDRLQPLDLSINKPAKEFLRKEFQNWYAQQICKQLDEKVNEPVDLGMRIMKPLGAQWLVNMYEYLSHSDFSVNGFRAAGIINILS